MSIFNDIQKNLFINVNKPKKQLKESIDSSEDASVYMNTWKNYNEYGADLEAYGIKDGWMTPEEGLAFCKKYAEDEPFINDVDNCPIEISEYDNAEEKLNELITYNSYEDKTLLKNAMETGQYGDNIQEYIDILERGDYLWFPGVSDDKELAEAYIDMVGFEGVANKESYFDEDKFRDEIESDERSYYQEDHGYDDEEMEDHEDDFQEWLDDIVEDRRENYDGNEEDFDYEAFGRDIGFDFAYTSDGAIQLL